MTSWFRHPLTPEVLEDALPVERRQSLHAAFAAYLEGTRTRKGESANA